MKKLLIACMLFAGAVTQANAQELSPEDYGYFNHLSAGISLGTEGIGFEVAAPLTYNWAVRTGFVFLPRFKYSKSLHLTDGDVGPNYTFLSHDVDLEGKLKKFDFKLLVDWYPFKNSSFHATAGFFWGNGTVVDIYNKAPFINKNPELELGIELGDGGKHLYTMVADQNGDVKAELKVNSFKPYLGVGFGRAIPKGRIGVQFDLGVQFWGRPEVWGNMRHATQSGRDDTYYEKIRHNCIINDNKDYKDLKDAIKTIEKIRVYPVLNIRINGRIF